MVRRRIDGAATENVLVKDVDDFDGYDLDSLIPESDPIDGRNAEPSEF
jgi:hypothetical protein